MGAPEGLQPEQWLTGREQPAVSVEGIAEIVALVEEARAKIEKSRDGDYRHSRNEVTGRIHLEIQAGAAITALDLVVPNWRSAQEAPPEVSDEGLNRTLDLLVRIEGDIGNAVHAEYRHSPENVEQLQLLKLRKDATLEVLSTVFPTPGPDHESWPGYWELRVQERLRSQAAPDQIPQAEAI